MLKRLLPAVLMLAASAASAVILPLKINLQGKLVDPASNAPRNGSFSVTFKIYSVPTGGAALYTEAQTLSVDNGVFSTQLGVNALLSTSLFSGASAYLGITVSPDAEMSPRQQMVMSPYAFTAAQLVSDGSISVNAGTAYSTFTTAGNWQMPAGVSAGSATFTGGLTASSGTFTATGAGQYALQTSSGIKMLAGTLTLSAASRGVDASGTGVYAATGTFASVGAAVYGVTVSSGVDVQAGTVRVRGNNGVQADYGVTASTIVVGYYMQNAASASPPVSPGSTGRLTYSATNNRYEVSENGGAYVRLVAPSGSQNLWDTNATAAVTNQGSNLPAALTELDSAVQGTRVVVNCDDLGDHVAMRYNLRVLTSSARTIVMSILDTSNTANVLATVSQAVTTANTTFTGESTYAAKPGWCTGSKEIAVYTSGGNAAADYIFKRIGLIWKP